MRISIIAAIAENGVIGRAGRLPWHLSDDLRRFKRLTMGHTMIMGRRTWESIGRPLPGRRTIVVSRQAHYRVNMEDVAVCESLPAALGCAESASESEAFVIGGAELYRDAVARVDRLYITRVHAAVHGDTYFPEIEWGDWQLVESEEHDADEKNEYASSFQVYDGR